MMNEKSTGCISWKSIPGQVLFSVKSFLLTNEIRTDIISAEVNRNLLKNG